MRNIIYGPPGTGKTTTLIGLMDRYLHNGGHPSKIIFTSFTRKSVDEAITRVMKEFDFTRDQLPFFRTIHSLCMGLSGIKNESILQFRHKIQLANELGLDITYRRHVNEGSFYGQKNGDKLFHLADYYRAKQVGPWEAWAKLDLDISWAETDRFLKSYNAFKRSNLLYDFTDMITEFISNGRIPVSDIMFVDEAQDLSPIQWSSVFKIETKTNQSYIAGDDDQGIYGWNGSDVNTFINLEGERRILSLSHRLNSETHREALSVIQRVSKRVPKDFKPSKEGEKDSVRRINYLDDLPLGEGEWLLLARNGYLLKEYEDHLLETGYLYTTPSGQGPKDWDELKAVIAYEGYRKTSGISEKQKKLVLQFTSDQNLFERPWNENLKTWLEVFDYVSKERMEFLRSAKRNGERLLDSPRIHLNTIHGVKGGEADNVCILTDIANTSWKSMELNPDEECRVFYVGITRARHRLYIKTPRTNKFFDI